MKPNTVCLSLVFLTSALSAAAQTTPGSGVAAPRPTLSAAEIAKRLSGIRRGSGGFNITPQEQARVDAGTAKINELNRAGQEALHSKNFAIAEADYREMIQIESDIPNSHYGLGEALAGEGKTAEALAVYKTVVYWPLNRDPRAIALNRATGNTSNLRGCCEPTDAVAWMKYVLLLSQTGQSEEAFSVYSQALRFASDTTHPDVKLSFSAGSPSPVELQAATHIALGLLVNDTGNDRELAMSEFAQARTLAPDAAVTNFYYSYGWKRLDLQSKTRLADAPQAKAALQKAALADDPNVKKAASEELRGLR